MSSRRFEAHRLSQMIEGVGGIRWNGIRLELNEKSVSAGASVLIELITRFSFPQRSSIIT